MTSLHSISDSIAAAVDGFVEPERLTWLWLVAACAVVMLVAEAVRTRLRRRLFAAFGSPRLAQPSDVHSAGAGRLRRWLSFGSRIGALILIVLAMADPRGGAALIPVKPVNLQTVVLLDRSRSMAARDASPNRFAVGQEMVRGLVEEAGGGAVALVSFAGVPQIEMPLTRDYQGLLERLDRLAPSNGPAAGTDLQAGLETAATCFAERMQSPKLLLVITDGETHGVEPELSATPLPQGTEVLVIRVGDADEGAPIPLEGSEQDRADSQPASSANTVAESFLTHEGQLVRSRANPRLLREIAEGLGGEFVSAEAASTAVAGLLSRTLRGARENTERSYRRQAAPRFHWLLLAAVGLLGLELLLMESRSSAVVNSSFASGLQRPAAWLLLAAATIFHDGQSLNGQQTNPRSPTVQTPTPLRRLSVRESSQLYNAGVDAYRDGRWGEAEALFDRVRRWGDEELQSKARFNLANTQYAIANRGGISKQEAITRLQTAIELYRQTLAEGQRSRDARANIEITYRRLRQIEQQSPDSQRGDGDENRRGDQSESGADGAGEQAGSNPGDADQGDTSQGDTSQGDSGQGDSGQGDSGQGDSRREGSGEHRPGRSGRNDGGSNSGPAAPPEASPESDLEEPLSSGEAEDQLRRIRQRARENEQNRRAEQEAGDEPQPPTETAASPGGLPW
ncbi:VWA domain-containing protein [Candidatus Laterigemmans baculatus]|uniref:VWA domain-containing protein n=1 Tax=Candidatus Laterigemmans baculatus TaxID=2770505 RepID=UPI0013DD6285|nr:VWA domain-containing protein [Candidatus Laterigemmans baculatus]